MSLWHVTLTSSLCPISFLNDLAVYFPGNLLSTREVNHGSVVQWPSVMCWLYEWEKDAEKQCVNSAHSNTRANGRLILTLCV